MSREFVVERMKPTDLTWLFPHEIINRLEMIAQDCGIDPETSSRKSVPHREELDALDELVNRFFLPQIKARTAPLAEGYGRLPKKLQQHVVHLIYSSLQAARKLQQTQPETPLGFPKGPQGVLSNLLSASWIDLTRGGTIPVVFEELDVP